MKERKSRLQVQMLGLLACCFLPMLVIITILFAQALNAQNRSDANTLRYTVQEINENIDRYVSNIYNVSDSFSSDTRLIEMLDRDYHNSPTQKRYAMIYIMNALFESYNQLQKPEQIDAIYVTARDELFDFADTYKDTEEVIRAVDAMGMNDRDRLGSFYWYPLRDNFLTDNLTDDPRQDKVVFGSRRVYSALKSGYPYLHIFAVQEAELYALYELPAERLQAEVYLLDENGGLLSSTDEAAVAACAAPAEVLAVSEELTDGSKTVRYRGGQYNAARITGELSGWTTLVLVPSGLMASGTAQLYLKTVVAMALSIGICAVVITITYRRFMAPLARLEEAMRRADAGDLYAYVQPQGQPEIAHMLEGYNAMLDGIRNGIEERVKILRTKQDLEMQVLMSQINPHFLYNTLETIVWKAGEAGRPDIGKLAASLGKLYRLSIAGGLTVPLQQELEHVQMYMNIQQSRYGGKVGYDVRLHGCDPAAVKTLKLILQPVVENSLLYGMEGLDHPLSIRVSVRRRGGALLLAVTDNGVGMDEAALETLRGQIRNGRKDEPERRNRRSTGIGLHNIQARLWLYGGPNSTLTVWSLPTVGTRVEIELHLETGEGEAKTAP